MEKNQRPKVGLGVMILQGPDASPKILLGKRNDDPQKASSDLHGEGTWTMPGGKLDFQETLLDGAYREVLEETGIKINRSQTKIISVGDDIVKDNHYITVGFLCKDFKGEPKTMEPEEITEWKWHDLHNLPEEVYPPAFKAIKNFLNNRIYING